MIKTRYFLKQCLSIVDYANFQTSLEFYGILQKFVRGTSWVLDFTFITTIFCKTSGDKLLTLT